MPYSVNWFGFTFFFFPFLLLVCVYSFDPKLKMSKSLPRPAAVLSCYHYSINCMYLHQTGSLFQCIVYQSFSHSECNTTELTESHCLMASWLPGLSLG